MKDSTAELPRAGSGAGRVVVVDGLRGLASLAVCWYHLVFANHAFVGGGTVAAALRDSAQNAWTGVEVFFVISGFVIPLALWRSSYTLRQYGSFLLKRLVRLDPPYLVSVVLCVVLWYLWSAVPALHGPAFTLSPQGLLLHVAYLNAFFHQGWLNPVYWTLAIEFQYYLGMGLLFAVLFHRFWLARLAGFAGLATLAYFIPAASLVFHYLFVFMLGMAVCQYFVGLLPLPAFVGVVLVLALGCDATLGPMVAGVSLATVIVIASVRRDLPLLGRLGAISYSLYLVHVPVGQRILELGLTHVHGGVARVLVLAVTLALTLAAATLLYILVERPAQRWSSAIRYRDGAFRFERRTTPVVTGIGEP